MRDPVIHPPASETDREPRRTGGISFVVEEMFLHTLRELPWDHPIADWKKLGVKHLDIKRGMGRHPVVFVETGGRGFVIKELGLDAAQREVRNYREMLQRGVHTLAPAGYVVREEAPIAVETRAGHTYERNLVAHTVTLLMDRVIPDSLLYRRAFKKENRRRIWDAIIDLFVELHSCGVYWGDASLANTLVKFLKVDIPFVGRKTRLKAFLADAETVEIHDSITDSLRRADVEFFLESMQWINEDLRASGIIRDEITTSEDTSYILTNYERAFTVAERERRFDERSGLTLSKVLGPVRDPAYLETLEKHIEEHKWYLSEREGTEVEFSAASHDWLQNVFVPVCTLFQTEGVMRYFPGKTASELYVEVMTHKYFLSQKLGHDVGITHAMREYAMRFGDQPERAFWENFARRLKQLLGGSARLFLS